MKSNAVKNILVTLLLAATALVGYFSWMHQVFPINSTDYGLGGPQANRNQGGRIVGVESVTRMSTEEVLRLSRQNYGNTAPQPTTGVTKAVVKFSSYDTNNQPLVIYARIYIPSDSRNLPIFAFAPGTTGIGDQCAPSLEQPQTTNWANYESHMVTYAGQGYASVTPDYEGMRDPDRIHHYMVGELEGRTLIDSVRALENWDGAKGRLDTSKIVLGGYSQGGHAAMWADKIATTYAPELQIRGVVGFGPVMDVKKTLADVTRGANINWFGPYVLDSYSDYYKHTYDLSRILQPQWITSLSSDVQSHCIDTNLSYWGHSPQAVYTPEFLQALSTSTLSSGEFKQLDDDLNKNAVGDQPTASAKLINEGAQDNVVPPGQQAEALTKLCKNSRGSVNLKTYPNSTHYNTMAHSFNDTINWMQAVDHGHPVESGCH
jgi:acetyl esterase/lipase